MTSSRTAPKAHRTRRNQRLELKAHQKLSLTIL